MIFSYKLCENADALRERSLATSCARERFPSSAGPFRGHQAVKDIVSAISCYLSVLSCYLLRYQLSVAICQAA